MSVANARIRRLKAVRDHDLLGAHVSRALVWRLAKTNFLTTKIPGLCKSSGKSAMARHRRQHARRVRCPDPVGARRDARFLLAIFNRLVNSLRLNSGCSSAW